MRALMLDPPILLLDEPLAALDPIARAELQVQLARIFRELGKTVVLVTHDVREAFVFGADDHAAEPRAAWSSRGRSPSSLGGRPTPFVAEFLRAQAPPPEMTRVARSDGGATVAAWSPACSLAAALAADAAAERAARPRRIEVVHRELHPGRDRRSAHRGGRRGAGRASVGARRHGHRLRRAAPAATSTSIPSTRARSAARSSRIRRLTTVAALPRSRCGRSA